MKHRVRWNEAGLAPAVVQSASTGEVLMLGWMNAEALERTLGTGEVHFHSRTRGTLWRKGETSGNILRLRSASLDCDEDAILIRAEPDGPVCHTGERGCFFRPLLDGDESPPRDPALGAVVDALVEIVKRRAAERPEGSYTAGLLAAPVERVAQKVGEEGVELALAAATGSDGDVVGEAADVLYHLLVALERRGLGPDRLADELRRRFPDRPA